MKRPRGFPPKDHRKQRTSQRLKNQKILFGGEFGRERAGGVELPSLLSGGSLQLPVGPQRGAEWGCVCCVVLRSVAL